MKMELKESVTDKKAPYGTLKIEIQGFDLKYKSRIERVEGALCIVEDKGTKQSMCTCPDDKALCSIHPAT